MNGSARLIFTAVIEAVSIFRGQQQLQKHLTVFHEQWHLGCLRLERHRDWGTTLKLLNVKLLWILKFGFLSLLPGTRLWRCAGGIRGTFEESMCLNLKSTWDITQPSGDEWHCFLLRREIASAECMLAVVPRDWSEVGHVRGTQHSFTRGRGHSN